MGNTNPNVHFKDGSRVKRADKAKYLGAILTEKGDGEAEIAQRIRSTTAIWRNLDDLWRHSRCTNKYKLYVYDAAVKELKHYR